MFVYQLAAVFLFILLLFFASIALQGELARRECVERERESNYPDRVEFNTVYSQYVGINALLLVLLLISSLMTFGIYSSYASYLENREQFSTWVESRFEVPVDEELADKVECYLGVLHYPQKGGPGMIPYPNDPECNEKTFNQKKASLDLVDKGGALKLWGVGVMAAWFLFFMVLIIARLLLKPKYDWTKLNQT